MVIANRIKMKNFLNTLIISITALVMGCSKEELKAPDFNVTTAKSVYNVGDSIQFDFSGKSPEFITFYSGEAGKEYRYKDRTEALGQLSLNITTQVLFGSQANNLRLLYSTDFNNKYTVEQVKAATWTDITSRFTLSAAAAGLSGVQVASGNVDITDLVVSGKPIYFAFQYVGAGATPSTQRTWRIYAFNFTSTSNGSTSTIGTATTAGWSIIDVANTANKWTYQSSAPFLFFAPSGGTASSEDWAISKAFFPTSVNPDMGVAIKTFYEKKQYHRHAYSRAGVYKITFVGTNASKDGVASTVRELEVTVQ